MDYLPLFLRLGKLPVLVVGAGPVAVRKISLLLAAGAEVTVVAPAAVPIIRDWALADKLKWLPQMVHAKHLQSQRLVFAATGDASVNAQLADWAQQANVFINVVDSVVHSDAIVPAIIDRSPLLVAVSTGGAAPTLATTIRARLESLLDESYGDLTCLLGRWRSRIAARFGDLGLRRRFYEELLAGPLHDQLRANQPAQAESTLSALLDTEPAMNTSRTAPGLVTLVGAGPGDPGLLTLAGLRALQQADVILHDRLVSREVLALARRDAQCILVGKVAGGASTSQDQINELLLTESRAGRRVVRLKGGDSFIFGRGGEELQVLQAAGIPFQVVPGITAALALAYAGVPLTHRSLADGVRFVSAQRAADKAQQRHDWCGNDTLVIYMGVRALVRLQQELLAAGRGPEMPVVLVENVSRLTQRVIATTLGEMAAHGRQHRLRSPAIVVAGEVARLATELHWFGAAPLATMAEVA